jgi:hypothetical protein
MPPLPSPLVHRRSTAVHCFPCSLSEPDPSASKPTRHRCSSPAPCTQCTTPTPETTRDSQSLPTKPTSEDKNPRLPLEAFPVAHLPPPHSLSLTQPLHLATDANPLPKLAKATVDRRQRRRLPSTVPRSLSASSLDARNTTAAPRSHLLSILCRRSRADDAIAVDI